MPKILTLLFLGKSINRSIEPRRATLKSIKKSFICLKLTLSWAPIAVGALPYKYYSMILTFWEFSSLPLPRFLSSISKSIKSASDSLSLSSDYIDSEEALSRFYSSDSDSTKSSLDDSPSQDKSPLELLCNSSLFGWV